MKKTILTLSMLFASVAIAQEVTPVVETLTQDVITQEVTPVAPVVIEEEVSEEALPIEEEATELEELTSPVDVKE